MPSQFIKRNLAGLAVLFALILGLALAACGENTPTPVPPSPTPAPTATPLPPTIALSPAATTAPSSGTAAGDAGVPGVSGTTEIKLDSSITDTILKQLPGVSGITIKLFVSDDDSDKVAAAYTAAFTGGGYSAFLPMTKQPTGQFGIFADKNGTGVLIGVGPVPADPAQFNAGSLPGISPDVAKSLLDQVKGKKTFVIILSGPNLINTLMALGSATIAGPASTPASKAPETAIAATAIPFTPTVAPPTPAPTTPATTAATSSSGGPVSLPTVSGVTEIKVDKAIVDTVGKQIPGVTGFAITVFVSDLDSDSLAKNYNSALTGAGFVPAFPLTKQDKAQVGIYGHPNGTDIVLTVADIPGDEKELTNNLNLPGVNADAFKNLVDQLKGKKTMVFILSGQGLLKAIFSGTSGSAGSSTPPSPASPPASASAGAAIKLGQTGRQNGYAITVNTVQKLNEISSITPSAANTFLAIEITIASESSSSSQVVYANALNAKIKDDGGKLYESNLYKEPSLPAKNNMAKGESVQGWLSYEVPKDAKNLQLVYNDELSHTVLVFDLGL